MQDSNSYTRRLLSLPVSTNMKDDTPTAFSNDLIEVVIDLMMRENVGAVVVVEDSQPVGIITEKDLLRRVINSKKDFERTLVKDVMSQPLITIDAERSISDALNIMHEHEIRRLIVTKNDSLVGLTTERRLLEIAYDQYMMKDYALQSALYDETTGITVAYISTYPPRECGIATYTEDLVDAMSRLHVLKSPFIVALNDRGGHHSYSVEVKFQIEAEEFESYARAAEYINRSNINIVNLQHEYGIFGGTWGEYLTAFLEKIEKPVVTTLHTVLEDPVPEAKEVLGNVLKHSDFSIVMAKVGIQILEKLYGNLSDKIRYIPHGCPNVPHVGTEMLKRSLGLGDRVVLSTFGLLSHGKGMEYVLEALPEVVKKEPRILYLIIGETHPEVRKHEGEEYREQLLSLVDSLGLNKNVKFVNRFLGKSELVRYLQATDIYIVPYPNREQISSGTLVYALSTGKAIVSTPFLQANEVILEGCAMGCEFKNPSSIADRVETLLDDNDLRKRFERRAYEFSREMIWPNVAMKYVNLFYNVLNL